MLKLQTYITHIIDETVNKNRDFTTIEKIRAPKDRSYPIVDSYDTIDYIYKSVGEYIYPDDLLINKGVNDINLKFTSSRRNDGNLRLTHLFTSSRRNDGNLTERLTGNNRKVRDFLKFLNKILNEHSMYVRAMSLDDEDNVTIHLCNGAPFR